MSGGSSHQPEPRPFLSIREPPFSCGSKRVVPKFEAHLLLHPEKGLTSVYRAFPKLKFKGKGHEASDLRKLLNKYAEWG